MSRKLTNLKPKKKRIPASLKHEVNKFSFVTFDEVTEPESQFLCAVCLSEFAHRQYPTELQQRHIDAAKRAAVGLDPGKLELAQLRKLTRGVRAGAGTVGMSHQCVYAASLLAAVSVDHEPKGALQQSALLTQILLEFLSPKDFERAKPEFDELVKSLKSSEREQFLELQKVRWRKDLDGESEPLKFIPSQRGLLVSLDDLKNGNFELPPSFP